MILRFVTRPPGGWQFEIVELGQEGRARGKVVVAENGRFV